MKLRVVVTYLAVLLSISPAFALTRSAKVTPESGKETGFTVKVEKREDSSIGFTITRELDKAPKFPTDPELKVEYTAYLKLSGPGELKAETMVAAREEKGTLVYWFSLSRAAIAHCAFSLWETQAYKDPDKVRLPGGGTIYDFDLAEFAAPLLKRPLPEHP